MRFAFLFAVFALLAAPAAAQGRFYDAPRIDALGKPGTLVRSESMEGAPFNAAAWRVLYRSTSFDGKPILVSGVVIVPHGPPPPGGRPIIAWAHPTTGVVPRCAPSLALFFFQQVQGLRTMVRDGYVVAATDYPGLGTPGPHPYLVGVSEARAVIDSVRVARNMPGVGAGNRFVVWGHSQGGQASLFTGLIAQSYAPELTLVGVAAAAPASELAPLMDDDLDSVAGKNLTAMTLWSWQRVYDAPMSKVVDPRAVPVVNLLAQKCIEGPWDLSARKKIGKPLNQYFLKVKNPGDVEPWHGLLAKNTPNPLAPDIPVFLAQGLDDEVVWPKVTENYFHKLCENGSRARLFLMQGVGHGGAATRAALEAVAWITDRFAGKTPPSDCGM
jgi:pimeloyl-ACP methyl ester carboxylesterase